MRLIQDPCPSPGCGKPIDRYPPAKVCTVCARRKELERYRIRQDRIKKQKQKQAIGA